MTKGSQQRGVPRDEAREKNREGQNQSAPEQHESEGGQPGQDDDLAGMRGQEAFRGGQQGQPAPRSQGDGERGGNR